VTTPTAPSSAAVGAAEPGWITGRLLLRVDQDPADQPRMASAAFELRAAQGRGELRLNSPLGTRLALALWSPGQAQLTTSQGTAVFPDLDALAAQALGEPVPLAALPDWLAGRPWPGAAHQVLQPPAEGFEQLGWTIDLSRRAAGWIEARRSAPPAVLLRVRLDPAEGAAPR
jgi:outer membrane lipoprotein LolB